MGETSVLISQGTPLAGVAGLPGVLNAGSDASITMAAIVLRS